MNPPTYQVVSLKYKKTCLYTELIQSIEERDTCWLRPLSLCIEEAEGATISVLDLGNGPDIICPRNLIQPVLDTDWLYILEQIAKSKKECDRAQANQHIRQFLHILFSQKTNSTDL